MTIREATIDDVPAIVRMGLRFLASTGYAGFLTPASPERLEWMVGIVLEHGKGFVAVDDAGELLGMIGFLVSPNELSGELQARELAWWTNPEARTLTAGPRLLAVAEEWATREGLSSITMIAPAGTTLHNFYARRGYQAVETSFLLRLANGSTDDHARARRPGRRSRSGDGAEDRVGQSEEGG